MKKYFYLFAAAAMLAACNEKAGYTITGNVSLEGSADGDTIFLAKNEGRNTIPQDTALLANGTFTFQGVQDSTEEYSIRLFSKEKQKYVNYEFFLENGDIRFDVNNDGWKVTGTPYNDAFTAYQEGIDAINNEYTENYKALQDTTLTEEQRESIIEKMNELGKKYEGHIFEQIKKNITTPVGIRLIRINQMDLLYADAAAVDSLLQQIPTEFANLPGITSLKGIIEKSLKTAVGQKFTDFEMNTPEGNAVKISDYVGKHKVVFIDFWASWCGPCRASLPALKKTYAEYHAKGFEIVGVSLDNNADNWKNCIKDEGLTWPQMSDLKGWSSEGAALYGVRGIPATVLLDSEGTIIARNLSEAELNEKLAELLK